LFRVILVSENKDQVSAVGGLRFTPDVTKDNCPELDLLIVPGGMGTHTQVKNANLLKWIANKYVRTRLTGSVASLIAMSAVSVTNLTSVVLLVSNSGILILLHYRITSTPCSLSLSKPA